MSLFSQATRRLVRKTSFPLRTSAVSTPVWNEVEYSRDGLEVVDVDPLLASHKAHLRYRYSEFLQKKKLIDENEGGIEEFSRGTEIEIVNLQSNGGDWLSHAR